MPPPWPPESLVPILPENVQLTTVSVLWLERPPPEGAELPLRVVLTTVIAPWLPIPPPRPLPPVAELPLSVLSVMCALPEEMFAMPPPPKEAELPTRVQLV